MIVGASFDNNLTPYYALVIALWGLFLYLNQRSESLISSQLTSFCLS